MQTTAGQGYCGRDMYADIRCRVVGSQERWDTTGQGVGCSLQDGLTCRGRSDKSARAQDTCHDYEISILCDCGVCLVSGDDV